MSDGKVGRDGQGVSVGGQVTDVRCRQRPEGEGLSPRDVDLWKKNVRGAPNLEEQQGT